MVGRAGVGVREELLHMLPVGRSWLVLVVGTIDAAVWAQNSGLCAQRGGELDSPIHGLATGQEGRLGG